MGGLVTCLLMILFAHDTTFCELLEFILCVPVPVLFSIETSHI